MRVFLILCLGCLAALAVNAPVQAQEVGDEWTEPITGMEFVWVPGGCYEMGCGEWAGNDCDEDEFPVHEVCVDGFWMGKYEVTVGQWWAVMRPTAPRNTERDNYPASGMTWNEAQSYMWRLEFRTLFLFNYRFPTEAEWEYACRSGGLEEIYSGSDDADEVAWHMGNAEVRTHQVGSLSPNKLGLYDMSGNVQEWVQDWYLFDIYSRHSLYNPVNITESTRRLSRGGSYLFPDTASRCSFRMPCTLSEIGGYKGLRLIMQE